jgi:hypothetical protein
MDRSDRDTVVVDDRALSLSINDHCANHIGDVDEEGLVRLGDCIAVHQHVKYIA